MKNIFSSGEENLMKQDRGFSLVEVVVTMSILLFVGLAIMNNFQSLSKAKSGDFDKTFASEKVIQMIEELRGVASTSKSVDPLDAYNDGNVQNLVLTTLAGVTDPGHPLSGNSNQFYTRNILITTVPNEPDVRKVSARVYLASSKKLLAEAVSIIRSLASKNVPTQVFDLYFIQIENVQAQWAAWPRTTKRDYDTVIQDLQNRNPGLEIRTHVISRLAYGRDPYYSPYINYAVRSDNLNPSDMRVYYYPGFCTNPFDNQPSLIYQPSGVSAKYNWDGVVSKPGPAFASYLDPLLRNTQGDSIADIYNHAVRYPEEERLFALAAAAAENAGLPAPEMSLRMLLEKMSSSPAELQNAMIVNFHGNTLPVPPMRNYSDAAKIPDNHPYVRAVTHPERIKYDLPGNKVKLRVYTYVTNPNDAQWTDHNIALSSFTIVLSTALNPANVSIRKSTGNSFIDYAWQDTNQGGVVDYIVGTDYKHNVTTITVFNSPLFTPEYSSSGRGLKTSRQLYGQEYIPCPVDNTFSYFDPTADFRESGKNLTYAGDIPKNTARWVITLGGGAGMPSLAKGMYTIDTRIGRDTTAGLSGGNQPTNLSRTFVWVGQEVPGSEMIQFMGDPRHMPYADLKSFGLYNQFFTAADLSAQGYENFKIFPASWFNGYNNVLNMDVPRFFMLYRTALQKTESIFNNPATQAFAYLQAGGEIGDVNTRLTPWRPNDNAASGSVREISAPTGSSYSPAESYNRLIARDGANFWYSRFWLGELYPDSEYKDWWQTTGNLPVGSEKYYRALYRKLTGGAVTSQSDLDPADSPATVPANNTRPASMADTRGSASFFNGGKIANSYFSHFSPASGNPANYGDLTTPGLNMAKDFNSVLPSFMDAPRPFRPDDVTAGGYPPEFSTVTYSNVTQRTTLLTFRTVYETRSLEGSHDSSAVIRMSTNTGLMGSVIVSGINGSSAGSQNVTKLSAIELIHTFLDLGLADDSRTPQIPLVAITSPTAVTDFNNPSSLNFVWTSSWTRWDNQPYTSSYPSNFSEGIPLVFNVKYSKDNGKTWNFIQDDAAAKPGILDSGASHAVSAYGYTWDVSNSAQFPAGTYDVRVEAYRTNRALHYAYQQIHMYFQR